MKLVPKLTLALVGAMCLVLAVNAYLRVKRELSYLEADRVRDHEMIGRALSVATDAVWRTEGKSSALEVVRAANSHFSKIEIRWVESPDVPSACAHAWPDLASFERAGGNPQSERRTMPDARTFLHTCVAVGGLGARMGAIELVENIRAEAEPAWTAVKDATATALAIGAVSALLSWLLGMLLVGRPVAALTQKARRIGRGDFAEPLRLTQNDEFTVLARELNTMAARLGSTLEQLRHADRLTTVGKLASGVAHELGTPLNVISARASMISAGETSKDETTEYARVIESAALRMTNIIQQLLEFARKKGAQKAMRDVRPLVGEAVELMRPLAVRRGVTLSFEASPEGDDIQASVDPGQIEQVVTNLLMNAMQSMPNGGRASVTVSRTAAAPPAAVDETPCAAVCIRVADEGVGIPPEHLSHVFEPFYTTKDVGEGTGLGLSVSYGIVEEHGGWITVDSKVGHGSTFAIFIPTREATS